MHEDVTNLLPQERRTALSRGYFLRLGVVGLVLITVLALISTVLLIPAYILLTDSARVKEARLATVTATLSGTDEAVLAARLDAISANAETLSALARAPSASAVIRALLDIARPSVTLSGFDYRPVLGKSPGMLVVSGTSATRDALRSYQIALQGAPFVLSASLPVSAFVKDSNLAFTITVTLAP